MPKYKAFTAAIGDPRSVQKLKDLQVHIGQLKLHVNDLVQAAESGFEGGLSKALQGLASGTLTVAGAFQTLAQSIEQSLAQVAARALAAKAVDALGSLFGNNKKSADVSKGAGKLTVASGALFFSSELLGANADKLQKAAETQLAANLAGSFAAFAVGGYTGAGGTYDVAGVVHAGEYVQPAHVVSQPGALGFMRDFHRQGMAAIANYAAGYADGGLVHPLRDVPAPHVSSSPRPRLQSPAGHHGGAAPSVNFRNVNVVDPELVHGYLAGGGGKDDVLNIISENRSTVRHLVSGG